ncbi:MAG: acetoacetate decarboxylase family protein [Pseudomonadota bacterium]
MNEPETNAAPHLVNNPKFNNARGEASTLQMIPPFVFKDMTVTVFPIRANLSQLRDFCDRQLNQSSDIVRFEPFLPYVYLMVLDYGKMSIDYANMGWISQCEVAFTVPLRWMLKKNGQWVFHDWAVNCPFIYVDNELSMSTGREVYGWPKVLARIDPAINDWISDPHGIKQVFEVQTKVGGRVERAGFRPLLSVHHDPIPDFLDMPPNLNGLLDPITRAPELAVNFTRMGLDVMSNLGQTFFPSGGSQRKGDGLFGFDLFQQMQDLAFGASKDFSDSDMKSGNARDMLWSMFPQMYMNTINFKQFRDASSPWQACYQAITNSKMEYDSINGCGPLGQQNLLMGHIDGGYRIDIHRYASQPVVDALGLEVVNSRSDSGVQVASFRPDFPFWLKVDMSYSKGKTIAWRSRYGDWHPGEGFGELVESGAAEAVAPHPSESASSADATMDLADSDEAEADAEIEALQGNPYNTTRGGALQERAGPYTLPNTTIRVLPLMADQAKLSKFAQSYLNVGGQTRFEAWGSYVYLIAYNYSKRSSDDEIDLFSSREVNIAIPVRRFEWYDDSDYDLNTEAGRKARDREKFVSAALVTPFAYVDDAGVAITSSEVHGVPTLRSDVGSPQHTWMDTAGPAAGEHLLKTSALVIPELGIGAGAEQESFLNVRTDEVLPLSDVDGWRNIANRWGPALIDDLRRKYAERGFRQEQFSESDSFRNLRGLALEVMAGNLTINSIALKQFRDCWETENACYQGIVQGSKRIDRLYEVNEIEQSLNVWITKFPTQPVSELLGLRPKYVTPDKHVEVFEAIRPFWLRADITEEMGQTLFERVGQKQWQAHENPPQLAGWHPTTAAEIAKNFRTYAEQFSDLQLYKNVPPTAAENVWVEYSQKVASGWSYGQKAVFAHDDFFPGQRNEDGTTPGIARISELEALEATGDLRDVKIKAHPIMAHYSALNHIDRVPVADLQALLDGKRDSLTFRSAADLGLDFGAVAPATLLDTMLSRQWGRHEFRRAESNKADFGVGIYALGSRLKDSLFPSSERQGKFWPLSGDEQVAAEHKRRGIAWQLWNNVQELIETATLEYDPQYTEKANKLLPEWFSYHRHRMMQGEDPDDWAATKWEAIFIGLRDLVTLTLDEAIAIQEADKKRVEESGVQELNDASPTSENPRPVSWVRVIRPLAMWRDIAQGMHKDLAMDPKPNASGVLLEDIGKEKEVYSAPNVADVLEGRFNNSAGS